MQYPEQHSVSFKNECPIAVSVHGPSPDEEQAATIGRSKSPSAIRMREP
jgi:hypothetical protein